MNAQLANLTLRSRTTAAVLSSLIAIPTILGSFAPSASSASVPQTAVPAYFSDTQSWAQISSADRRPGFVVANPSSGPGTVKAPWIAAAYLPALTAGVPLAGYIHTGYGNRPLQQVLTDIDNYRTWYGITRIFLDETPYQCDTIPYYSSIVGAVHQQGGTVILNPGMNPESCWSGVAEVVVNFEGSAATYQTWQPAAWTQTSSSTAFWHVIYGAGLFDGTSLLETAGQRNATWAYITDDVLPNPFDRLPGEQLWKKLTSTTDSGVINLTPTPPTTPTTTAPTTTTPTTEPPTTVAPTTVAPTTIAPTTIVASTVAPTTAPPTTGTRSGVAPTTALPSTTNSSPTTVAPASAGPSIPQTTISGSIGNPSPEGNVSVAGTETSTTKAPGNGATASSNSIPTKLALTAKPGASGKTRPKSPVTTTTKAKKAAGKPTIVGLKTPSAVSNTVSTSVATAVGKPVAQKRSAE